ncbi:hypothetical protein [Kitasatospora aureofaciens]|uniref:hypothetical protein n=1 Tax=Kitasatospora aureofaciens TaxID=1894 RepID=UPI0033DFECE3
MTALRFHPADVAALAAAEYPVMLQLVTGRSARTLPHGAAITGRMPARAVELADIREAEDVLTVEVEAAAELAQAAVRPLHPWATDPYKPQRGEAGVRLVGALVGSGRRITAKLEFNDASQRGPERRKLAALLAPYYGVEFERVCTWRQYDIETGYEKTERGAWRATSERREVPEFSYGRGRTDARIWGTPADVARYVAVLPIVLDELDRLSLQWGKQVRRWLTTTDAGECFAIPSERRSIEARARREFRETIAYALGAATSPTGVPATVDPTQPLPFQSRAAALAALAEHGRQWLDQWQRPKTEAALETCAILADRIAARITEARAEAARAAAEAERAAAAPAAVEPVVVEAPVAELADVEPAVDAADDDQAAAELIAAVELAAAELAATAADASDEDEDEAELGYREAPHSEPAPRVERHETPAELRAQAAILQELNAPAAARILLDQAEEMERATTAASTNVAPAAVEAPVAEAADVEAQAGTDIKQSATEPAVVSESPTEAEQRRREAVLNAELWHQPGEADALTWADMGHLYWDGHRYYRRASAKAGARSAGRTVARGRVEGLIRAGYLQHDGDHSAVTLTAAGHAAHRAFTALRSGCSDNELAAHRAQLAAHHSEREAQPTERFTLAA